MSRITSILLLISVATGLRGQTTADDAFFLRDLFEQTMRNQKAYTLLGELCAIGPRISASPEYDLAARMMQTYLQPLPFDTVYRQPCMVRNWKRNGKAEVSILKKDGSTRFLHCISLGNSHGSGDEWVSGEVIELTQVDQLRELSPEEVEGKIIFFNRPMDPGLINSFNAYGRAVDQRYHGPLVAAEKGAAAVLVRSMTQRTDTIPHSGSCGLTPEGPGLPAIAISTVDAKLLSALLQKGEIEKVYLRNNCYFGEPHVDHNVIAEIRGSEYPDEIILVGGHLDSWDVGQGAHDDGAGCTQAVAAAQELLETNYRPRRTLRVVLFANEENGLAGAKEYARVSNEKGEFHLAAIESDRGGFTPRGFTCTAEEEVFNDYFKAINGLWDVMEPYDLSIKPGGSGADINPLKSQGGLLIGLYPDPQRYFDYHHAPNDRFEAVHPREISLSSAAMSGLIYLIDKYGLDGPTQ